LDDVIAKTNGREDEEVVVQREICKDFRDEEWWSDVDNFEDTLCPEFDS